MKNISVQKGSVSIRLSMRKVLCAFGLILMLGLSMLGAIIAYHYTPRHITPCEVFGSGMCKKDSNVLLSPSDPWLLKSDDEISEYVLARELIFDKRDANASMVKKVAFLFLTKGPLPFELLWEQFFKGYEGLYSIYVHASDSVTEEVIYKTKVFQNRIIRSQKVSWGNMNMVDAERRLLTRALLDPSNRFFVLLSDTCVPLFNFDYTYKYLMNSSFSFVDSFDDPGPHGRGRYLDYMLPQVQINDWRKGAQWFAVNRPHALLLVADHVYYRKFKLFCKAGDQNRNCYPDEHYVQTFLHIMDPGGLSNWTVTHVDWSERKWHPKTYEQKDISIASLRKLQMIDEYEHVTSNAQKVVSFVPCIWNGIRRPCFLFARKFRPETCDLLLKILPNMTWNVGTKDMPPE